MIAGKFTTEIGTLRYNITCGTHVYIGAESRENPVVLRNVKYHVSFHFYLQPDGSWKINEKWIDRVDRWSEKGQKYPSDSATKKITEVIETTWKEFIQNSDNQRLFVQAEQDRLIDKIEVAKEELKKLREEVNKKEQEIQELQYKLSKTG